MIFTAKGQIPVRFHRPCLPTRSCTVVLSIARTQASVTPCASIFRMDAGPPQFVQNRSTADLPKIRLGSGRWRPCLRAGSRDEPTRVFCAHPDAANLLSDRNYGVPKDHIGGGAKTLQQLLWRSSARMVPPHWW